MNSDGWSKIENQNIAIVFWRAATMSLMNGNRERCPNCSVNEVKFYAHHFGSDRSGLWVWCSACKVWTVASNMKLEFSFDDPYENYSADEFAKLEKSQWLDHLNELFVNGTLPQSCSKPGTR